MNAIHFDISTSSHIHTLTHFTRSLITNNKKYTRAILHRYKRPHHRRAKHELNRTILCGNNALASLTKTEKKKRSLLFLLSFFLLLLRYSLCSVLLIHILYIFSLSFAFSHGSLDFDFICRSKEYKFYKRNYRCAYE